MPYIRASFGMVLGIAAGLAAGAAARGGDVGADPGPFDRGVRPILERCVTCHGGDEPAGELDLTTRGAALQGGESGPALRPGDAATSLLYRKVAARKMPPKKPLAADQVEALRRWIDGGAAWEGTIARTEAPAPSTPGPEPWAFHKLERPDPPPVIDQGWQRNPIDRFVLARLEAEGLRPAPPADRATWIRRAAFDLTGLPPTPEEVEAFVRDPDPAAEEALIDRLLASPQYGERWGRHWLDLARFAESHGFEFDRLREHAWRYRDYVIRSLNDDIPYDQFVRQQIAGDVIEPITADGIAATGFLVAGPWDEAGNESQKSVVMRTRMREEELEDMVAAVSQTFLGLTVNCARCHDHKFDPIPQRDYYRLKAALEGIAHGNRPALPPEELAARNAKIGQLDRDIKRREEELITIEQTAREEVTQARGIAQVSGRPSPIARWTFEVDGRDSLGRLNGSLEGGAAVHEGRLHLDRKAALLRTGSLPQDLNEKTLEAWVVLANLAQRGGGVLTVEGGPEKVFDSIAYAERQPRKWVPGSEMFRRTQDLAGPEETAGPEGLVHLAIAYHADGRIAAYRNGQPYGDSYRPEGTGASLQTFPAASSHVLIGLRHTGSTNGSFAGQVEEARLYDHALSPEDVATSFQGGVDRISTEEIVAHLPDEQRQRRDALLADLALRRKEREAIPPLPLVYAANPKEPPPTHVLARGDVERPGERVAAGGLSAIRVPSSDLGLVPEAPEADRRRRLAAWIADPANPLTARVLVNRVWHYHFGVGLVATPNDFGVNGERPSHPELLDWLASEFLARGGRVKALHRLIMNSATYRQASRFDPKAAAKDAEDRLLWRFPPRRLEAEAIRDAMLALGGQLNPAMGGPSFRPFTMRVFGSNLYTPTDPTGAEFDRRTVYRINVNSAKNPLLEALDCPDPSVKTPRRAVTTTPLQALGLMNNSFVRRQARDFARRVAAEAGTDPTAQVARAYRLALGRAPTAEEASRTAGLARDHGLEQACWVLLNSSEFLYLK